jgi:hypothetical protein
MKQFQIQHRSLFDPSHGRLELAWQPQRSAGFQVAHFATADGGFVASVSLLR